MDEYAEASEMKSSRISLANVIDELAYEVEQYQIKVEAMQKHLDPILGPPRPEPGSSPTAPNSDGEYSSALSLLNSLTIKMRMASDSFNRTMDRVQL